MTLVLITTALTTVFICGILFISKLKGQLTESQSMVAELYNQAIEAEKSEAAIRKELDFLQANIVQLAQRTVAAVLNDNQVNQIVQALIAYANALNTPPKDQN